MSHLGDIAIRTGRKIRWDPQKETIVGDEAAARMMHRPLREPGRCRRSASPTAACWTNWPWKPACGEVPGQGDRGMLAGKEKVMKQVKVIIEKHPDGYVAYPVGVKGVVVGEGDSYEDALRDVQSALKFHLETFGTDVLDGDETPVLEAFVAEASV